MIGARTLEANMGGPRSRGRSQRVTATVLGDEEGPIRCSRLLRVGLNFGRKSPLNVVRDLIRACGFDDEEDARRAIVLPPLPCICRVDESLRPKPIASMEPDDALFQAMVLGLCTPWRYDPGRPMLWTRTSLTRRLELFSGQGFYA